MDQYLLNSTRNKPKSIEKEKQTKHFFRKKQSTDENEKNSQNYFDKINGLCSIQKTTSINVKKPMTKSKKQVNGIMSSQKNMPIPLSLINPNLKSSITSSLRLPPATTTNMGSKDKNIQNLRLGTSGQLPKMLIKSISQTTVNKKYFEQKKTKIFQKLGFPKKKQTYDEIKHFNTISNMNKNQKQPRKTTFTIKQFHLGKKLGNGRFGNVYLAEEKKTSMIYAIKILNKAKVKDSGMQDQVVSEIKLQIYMNHPNILKLYGFFHDQKNIYLILQYCSQCLFRQFRHKNKFNEQQTAFYVKQAISSLKYMHNQSIIHRDIKPENILIQHGVLKMSDFGWSIYSPIYKRQTFCGTVDYVPPEIVQGNSYDERVDVWAIGILLYQLASGCAPFQTKDEKVTYEKIVKSKCKFPNHFSQNLKNLVSLILQKNPSNRPNLAQIESHEWFQEYKTVGRYISKDIWHFWNMILQRQ